MTLLGSAPLWRVGFGVTLKQSFFKISTQRGSGKQWGKCAIARTQSPTRETRALPIAHTAAGTCQFLRQLLQISTYGRGGRVGRDRGVGRDLGVALGVGVGLTLGDGVAVGVGVGVALGVGVGVGTPPGVTKA